MSFQLVTTSYPAFEDFQRRNITLSEMTRNYFDRLGVQPRRDDFFTQRTSMGQIHHPTWF